MKENKHFTAIAFLIPFIYVSVVGLFFHDTSKGVCFFICFDICTFIQCELSNCVEDRNKLCSKFKQRTFKTVINRPLAWAPLKQLWARRIGEASPIST